jgi:hypothetical protein
MMEAFDCIGIGVLFSFFAYLFIRFLWEARSMTFYLGIDTGAREKSALGFGDLRHALYDGLTDYVKMKRA